MYRFRNVFLDGRSRVFQGRGLLSSLFLTTVVPCLVLFFFFYPLTPTHPRLLLSTLPLIPPVTSPLVQLFRCEAVCKNHLVSGVGAGGGVGGVDAGRCVDEVLICGEQALMGIGAAQERS